MEVMVSSPTLDFEFSGAKTSPERLGAYYLSAPTSPSRVSEFYREFDYFSTVHVGDSASSSPCSTVQKAIIKDKEENESDDGFAFFVSQESEALSVSAEELFDGGKIKPLKVDQDFTSVKSPLLCTKARQPKSPLSQGKKVIADALSPKKKKERESVSKRKEETEERRGRDRTLAASKSGRRATRSHSPDRVSEYRWDEQQHQSSKLEESESSSNSGASLSSKSSRKWRLRDFLLFRSASEGRGSNKDPFRKYSVLYKKPEEVKNSSVRSTDSPRRKGPISAHEFHYAIKKAESQDLKKKTFLPYRQGILGRLAGLGSFSA